MEAMQKENPAALIRRILDERGDVNAAYPELEGLTPAAFLLKNLFTPDPGAVDETGDLLEALLRAGARVSLLELVRRTFGALMFDEDPSPAVRLWKRLIAAGADVREVRLKTFDDGDTERFPLVQEVITNARDPWCRDIVQALLDAGADPRERGFLDRPLPYFAIEKSNDQTLSLLLARGATLTAEEANKAFEQCQQPRIIAILRGAGIAVGQEAMADAMASLLRQLASCYEERAKSERYGPLIAGFEAAVTGLFDEGYNPNWRSPREEEFPLQCAVDTGQAHLVKLFLDRGAVAFPSISGGTAETGRLLADWRAGNPDWRAAFIRSGGSMYIAYYMGMDYLIGEELPKNPARAVALLTLAADQGYADAQYMLAQCLMEGEGAPCDPARALRYFDLAARQGKAEALYALGQFYRDGQGVLKDERRGFNYFVQAAQKGHNEAIYDVGHSYHIGCGVAQDYGKAAKWYKASADLNDPDGLNSLGYLYLNGLGVPRNIQIATDLFAAAAAQGNALARDNVQMCVNNGYRPRPLHRSSAAPATAAPAPAAQAGRFCTHCGQGLPAGSRFCGKCGKPTGV